MTQTSFVAKNSLTSFTSVMQLYLDTLYGKSITHFSNRELTEVSSVRMMQWTKYLKKKQSISIKEYEVQRFLCIDCSLQNTWMHLTCLFALFQAYPWLKHLHTDFKRCSPGLTV